MATIAERASQPDRAALETLFVNNEDFAKLESLISEFNIFEALGAVRQELRHSELLAFLLDPSENHGLGADLLRKLLERAVRAARRGGTASLNELTRDRIDEIEFGVLELDEVEVRREWEHIDILVLDDKNRLAILIENKVDSGEHSDQLRRYWDVVGKKCAGYARVALYLTPDGDTPSDERYIAVDYECIADLVKKVVEARASTIGPDVKTLLRHYEQMVRRHIMTDTEIAVLCRKLYRNHRHALELIFKHRPDHREGVVRDEVERLLRASPDLELDESNRKYLRFTPRKWDSSVKLRAGTGAWTPSKRMLLFEVVFDRTATWLKLTIGPGASDIREAIFKAAKRHAAVFRGTGKDLSPSYQQVFKRGLLDSRVLESEDEPMIRATLAEHWAEFLRDDLPAIMAAIEKEAVLSD